MYKKIILLVCLVGQALLYGQSYYSTDCPKQGKIYETNPAIVNSIIKVALYKAGDYWGVIHKLTEKDTLRVRDLYNIAASYDKLNMPDETLHYLYRFMEISKDDREILAGNDFPNLRSHPDKWEKVTQCIDSLFLSVIGNVENRELALKIFHINVDRCKTTLFFMSGDTVVTYSAIIGKKIEASAPAYIIETEKILKEYGFPTEKMIGRYGVFQVYDVVHHTTLLDLYYRKVVKKAFEEGALDSILYALMTDRVLTHKDKKQIYGTQWMMYNAAPKNKFGKYVKKYPDTYLLLPVKDFANLNERRKQMGFTDTIEEMMEGYKKDNYFIPPEYYKTKSKKQK
jgi:hypothetical protein